jgi:host factor-I protein
MLVVLCNTERRLGEGEQQEQKMTAQSTSTFQNTFLGHLRDNNVEVTMFLVNGIRIQGQIRLLDNFTFQLVRGSGTQIVYKHAISAIHPVEAIELTDLISLS